jgi:arylsulfatase A-like enzyme
MSATSSTRRAFLTATAAGLAAPAGRAAPRQPNLLYVFSDEHRACSMPGEPFSEVFAPNLEAFARQGMTFRNCVSNYPVCSPYRSMLLTGRWPYQTGVVDNAIQPRSDQMSIAQTYRRAGHQTGYIGKWHLSPRDDEPGEFIPKGPVRLGFDDWHVWSNTNGHRNASFTFDPESGAKIQPNGYNATLMTDQAVDFIGRYRDRPWMLVVSWNPPHDNNFDAPPEQRQRYDPGALKFRPNVGTGGGPTWPRITPELRQRLRGYYSHISAIDVEFGRLLRQLQETGQAERTILVYSSDHGSMMGSQGWDGKRLPWEESCRVPFLIRYPGVIPAGSVSDCLLSTIDLYPTLSGITGLRAPESCAGRDLSPVMRGQSAKYPESVFLMHIAKGNSTGANSNPAPLFRGVRTAAHTYTVAADGRWCLYNNLEDPFQMQNRIDDPGMAGLCRDMDGLVLDWLRKAGDPFPYEEARRKRLRLG